MTSKEIPVTIQQAYAELATIDDEIGALVADHEVWKNSTVLDFLHRSQHMVDLTTRYIELTKAIIDGTNPEPKSK